MYRAHSPPSCIFPWGILSMREKAELRTEYLARRDALSQSEISDRSHSILERLSALPEFLDASQILSYVSKDNEVVTSPLIRDLLEADRSVLVPISQDDGTLVWSSLKSLDDLGSGAFGVPEPLPNQRRIVEPAPDALVIVPCVAFTPAGGRLGHGKGYFDRFLAQHSGTSVGLAFESQKIERLPIEEHDIALDIVLTESGCYGKG